MDVLDYFTEEQKEFYRAAMQLLEKNKMPYLIGGAFAIQHYTGIYRNTKDLDMFCKAGDYQELLKIFSREGYQVEVTDSRWIAKVFKDDYFIDVIFNTTNHLCPVDDSWFDNAREGEFLDCPVSIVAPEDLIWCKTYIQDRGRYDGADVNHLILKASGEMDWKRLLERLDQHWHLLLGKLLNFQFVYPADRDVIPRWLFDQLLERAKDQFDLPPSENKVCMGPVIDHSSYAIDIKEWNYKSLTLYTT